MPSIAYRLDQLANELRLWAAKQHFVDKGYYVEWGDYDASYYTDPILGSPSKPLTLERYKKGESTNSDPSSLEEDLSDDQNHDYFVARDSEVWNYKIDDLAWVNDLMADFGQTDIDASFEAYQQLQPIVGNLCGKADWGKDVSALERDFDPSITGGELLLGGAIDELENWGGDAAATFRIAFDPGEHVWENACIYNYLIAEAVLAGMEAQLSIQITARNDIITLAETTVEALKQVHDLIWTDDDQTALSITGTLVTLGLSLASFGTASALAGAAFAISGALTSQMSNGESNEDLGGYGKKSISVEAATADGTLDMFKDAVQQIKDEADQKELDLAEQLQNFYDGVLQIRDKAEITYDKSDSSFADANKENMTDQNYLGQRQDSVQANTSYLEEAAKNAFPKAAEPILRSRQLLEDTHATESVVFKSEHNRAPSEAIVPWSILRDILQDFTANNGGKIRDAGVIILEFAKESSEADIEGSSELSKMYDELSTESSGTEHAEYPSEEQEDGSEEEEKRVEEDPTSSPGNTGI